MDFILMTQELQNKPPARSGEEKRFIDGLRFTPPSSGAIGLSSKGGFSA